MLIGGAGQAISGAGRGTSGKILAYADEASHGYVLADAGEAYRRNSRGTPGPGVERARRHAVFVRPADGLPAYVVLYDDIRKDAELHTFTWLMHTYQELTADLLNDGAVLRPAGPSGRSHATSTTTEWTKSSSSTARACWFLGPSPSRPNPHPSPNVT